MIKLIESFFARVYVFAVLLSTTLIAQSTITVTTTNDIIDGTTTSVSGLLAAPGADTKISFREAVIAINNTGNGYTINLPAGIYLLTIPGTDANSAVGDIDIRQGNTTIQGAGAASTIIQQTTADRVIELPVVAQVNFTIKDVTIKGGFRQSGGPGGLWVGSSNPASITTIENCIFTENRVGSGGGAGGAIAHNPRGILRITNCTFTSNSSYAAGGALYLNGVDTLTMTGCIFKNDSTVGGTEGGGAVFLSKSAAAAIFNISQCSFENNYATQVVGGAGGGAIILNTGTANINYCRFFENVQVTGAGNGTGNAFAVKEANAGSWTYNIENNWWSRNSGPASGDLGSLVNAPVSYLQLRNSADSVSICVGTPSLFTADLLGRNTGGIISSSDLAGLPSFPSSGSVFGSVLLGTLLGTATFINGIASVTYTAGASGGTGSVTATADNQNLAATLTIKTLPGIVKHPANVSKFIGSSASFSPEISGINLTYQWRRGTTNLNNGGNISGVNLATLTINPVSNSDGASDYNCVITGGCGSITTNNASLSVVQVPTVQASGITFSQVNMFSFTINWVNGNGSARLVVVREGSSVNSTPANVGYSQHPVFGSVQLGTGNYIVYNGAGNSVTVYRLSSLTTYHVAIFEYNVGSGEIQYLTESPAINNQITLTFNPSPGNALKFSGAGETVLINNFPTHPSYSYEAWVKPDDIADRNILVYSNTSGPMVNWSSQLRIRLGKFEHYLFDGGIKLVSGTTSVTAGIWYHVVGSADQNGMMHLFVNGVEEGTPAAIGTLWSGNRIYIGSASAGFSGFAGTIDGARIWRASLTAQQIRDNMYNTLSSPQSNSYSSFLFDEGTGNNAIDYFSSLSGVLSGFSMNSSSGWVTSTIPAGGGTSTSASSFTSGTASLGNLSLTMTDNFDNAVDISGVQVNNQPNVLPDGFVEVAGNRYFLINTFGTPGIFTANITLNFGAGILDTRGDAFPAGVKLYKRSSNSDGAWTFVNSAASVNSTTGVVTFNGISSFSQFVIAEDEQLLPVELNSFSVSSDRLNAKLKWTTATEINNYGFEVERSQKSGDRSQKSEGKGQWEKSGFVKGNGNSNSIKEYEFVDKQLTAGKYLYRLKQIDTDGSFEYSEEIEVEIGTAPMEFNLAQNYPNPFNPETTIEFTLPENGIATLKVFNILGEEVAILFNEIAEAGKYQQVRFNASHLATGIYIARLQFGNPANGTIKQTMKKMLMIK